MKLKKYFSVWLKTTTLAFQEEINYKLASLMFISAKLIRFAIFTFSLFIILGKTREIAGFNLQQMLIFFLTFNLLDTLGQFFFRGIYWFRNQVINGELDMILLKPINPLFSVLTSHTDILDLPLLFIVTAFLIKEIISLSLVNIFAFLVFSIAGLIITTGIHIFVAGLGIITTEVDHTIWIFRDLSLLARVPVEIYTSFLRGLLTFIVPVALIYNVPAKALMGMLSPNWMFFYLFFSFCFFYLSYRFWHFALKKYSSASS